MYANNTFGLSSFALRQRVRRRARRAEILHHCVMALTLIVMVVATAVILYEIEAYQLEQQCSEWGWTYCVPK